MLKRWSLKLNLTAGSACLSLRVAAETLIPSAAVESRRLSGCLKIRRLLPWIKFKTPSAPPFPQTKRLRKKKSLSKIGFLGSLRKIRLLFRRHTILPAASAPTDDEYEQPRRSLSPRSPNSRKAAAVASLLAVVVAWILSESIRQRCGPGESPGQCSCLSSLLALF